ncbi:KH domain-containing protein [Nostocaceae cyanobacterium CENA357]|uniref:KH domain-containing protein n=1 Tax=Atlanticothrix silvestris CENA357 TaxID=1725252 RepID=A0A8J7HPY3_9CYAN|nr:KH domain-containing protein [Atlanticothrix silvestris]MBH8556290.1 KH domain-containing protein [Atlanticothrix silvestris CENA357]
MFLNRSVPQPHPKVETKSPTASPNYVGLVRFLMQPFLESPETLSVDCEISHTLKRAWIRIAFDSTEKGKVFGRGGRNIQAIRTVIAAAAEVAGQSVYLDIYGSNAQGREGTSFDEDREEQSPPPKTRERRGNDGPRPIPITKPRFR